MISALLSAQTFGWAKPRRLLVDTRVLLFINNKCPYHDRDKGLQILNIFEAILHQFDSLYVHINEKSGPRIMKQSYNFKVKYLNCLKPCNWKHQRKKGKIFYFLKSFPIMRWKLQIIQYIQLYMFIHGWNLDISLKKCIVFRKHSVLSNFSFRVTTLLVQWKMLPRKCQCWLHVVLRSGKFRWGRGE